MSIKHLTYLDIPVEQRKKAASAARERIKGILASPFLTQEQKTHLSQEMLQVGLWEKGALLIK